MCSLSNEITHTTVDVDTVRSKIKDDSLRLIDVRREEDYNKGHIKIGRASCRERV